MFYTCFTKVSYVWVVPSCGDNTINRTMVWVVATVVRISGDACRASRLLYYFHTFIGNWAEINLL
jgi:hypothetical protein